MDEISAPGSSGEIKRDLPEGFDPSVQTSHRHTRSLDGLRGMAALTVVLSHVFLLYFPSLHQGTVTSSVPGWVNVLATSPITFFYRGGLAVMLFFVLSGYVLTHGYVAHSTQEYAAKAAAKRYIRLGGPVLVASLIGSAVMNVDILVSLREGLFGALLYAESRSNYVLWTICYEFYGSLFVFAVLGLFGAFRRVCVAVFAIAAILLLAQKDPYLYFGLFAVGALLRICGGDRPGQWKGAMWVGVLLLLGGAWLGGYQSNIAPYAKVVDIANVIQFRGGLKLEWPQLFQGLGAVIMVTGFIICEPCKHLFATRPMAWLGKVSFGCYLLHPFVLEKVGPFAKAHIGGGTASMLFCLCAVVVCTLVLAEVFYRWVDRPCVNLANAFARWAIRRQVETPHGMA